MPVRELLTSLARFPDPISRAEEVLRNLPFLRDYVEATIEQVARLSKGRAPWESPVGRGATYGDPTFTAVAILEEHESYQLARAVVRFVDRLPKGVRQVVEDVYVRETRTCSDLSPEERDSLQDVLDAVWRLVEHASPPLARMERVAS